MVSTIKLGHNAESMTGNDSQMTPEDRLRDNISGLIDLCRDIIVDAEKKGFTTINVGLVDIASATLSQWNATNLIGDFIKNSHIYWEQIRCRDEEFFQSNLAIIFANVPLIDMPVVARLFHAVDPKSGELLVPLDDREAVWDFLTAMVKICIRYIHDERKPCIHKVGEKYQAFYQRKFFPDVKLEYHAKQWEIKLSFQ